MQYLLIPCVLCFAANGFCTRLFQVKFKNGRKRISLFQSVFCFFAAICFFASSPELPKIETVLCGLLWGALFFCAVFFSAKGFDTGSMSLTSAISNMSLIIPILYSVAVVNESVTATQIIGMAAFIAVFIMASFSGGNKEKNEKGRSNRFFWIAAVSIAFISNGATAVIQKSYRLNSAAAQNRTFMAIGYITAAILFFAYYLIYMQRLKDEEKTGGLLPLAGLAALAGAGSFGGNLILSFLSDKIDGAVLYPCVNGGLCISIGILSFVVFREKPTPLKLCAFVLGIAAIIILNI